MNEARVNNRLSINDVENLYDMFPFPGRVVKVIDSKRDFRKKILIWLSKNTLFGKSNIKRIRSIYNSVKENPKIILDAACGTGELACLLALAFPDSRVIAFDLSRTNLGYAEKLKKILSLENLEFLKFDLMCDKDLPFHNVELAVCSGAIHHLSNPSKGIKKIGESLSETGMFTFGVYGQAFYKEKIISSCLRNLFPQKTMDEQLRILRSLNITRQGIIKEIKKEKILRKILSTVIRGDFSYIGYLLFPHYEPSIQMDGFFHPIVKYYNPDSIYEDVEAADMELVRFNNIEFPPEWEKMDEFINLSYRDKFRLLDACNLVAYTPICRRMENKGR